jgi:hypothetical protein
MSLRINALVAGLSTRACRSTAGSMPARWPSSGASALAPSAMTAGSAAAAHLPEQFLIR